MYRRSLIYLMAGLPWQINAFISILCYPFFMYLVPTFEYSSQTATRLMTDLSNDMAYISALFFIFLMGLGVWLRWRDKHQYEAVTGIASMRKLTRVESDNFLRNLFERRGFQWASIAHAEQGDPVRFILICGELTILLYDRCFKNETCSVEDLKAAHGVVGQYKSNGVLFVTTGRLTTDAQAYCRGKSIEIVDGNQLAAMVKRVLDDPFDETRKFNAGAQ